MRKIFFLALIAFAAAVFLSSCNSCVNKSSREGAATELQTSEDATLLCISSGKIAGYIENGVYTYKGIPYAKAERFMPPEEPDSWEGVRSCRAHGPTCPQGARTGWYSDEQAFAFSWDDGFPNEDCLRVNVWTRGVKDKGKRPVMVWLHGGGYSAGSGQELPSYDGSNLARNGDVVVVTLNHRLNVLGFLDLSAYGEKYAQSGNVGLLDIIEALKWVQKNIEAFGGDPGNVTVFGQSGGGGKVSTLLATPSARGLFHKAIIQSGAMLRTMEPKYSRMIGKAVVDAFGIKGGDIAQLQQVPYDQLLAAGEKAVADVKKVADAEGFSSFIFGWAPTVDGVILPRQPFDPAAPEFSADVPIIVGTTRHEFTTTAYVPQLRNVSESEAVEILRQRFGSKTEDYLAAFDKAWPEHNNKDLIDTDVIFRPSAVQLAGRKARQGGAPVYMYMFTWESPVLGGIFRSTHCMEIPFVFDNADLHNTMTGGGEEAIALAEKMSAAWVSFARSGVPEAKGLPEWEPYTLEGGATMFFDNECEVRYHHDKDLMDVVFSFPVRGF